jgi:uncharacterized protein
MKDQIFKLTDLMINYYTGDAKRIQHFLKVHSFCKLIAYTEDVSEDMLMVLEAAAIVHDCGIKAAEKLYGKSSGKCQEELGPSIAEKMLLELNFSKESIERICFLVGHHHTYKAIDGLDFQILAEADMLVNVLEDELGEKGAVALEKNLFKTTSGKKLLNTMYLKPIDYSNIHS